MITESLIGRLHLQPVFTACWDCSGHRYATGCVSLIRGWAAGSAASLPPPPPPRSLRLLTPATLHMRLTRVIGINLPAGWRGEMRCGKTKLGMFFFSRFVVYGWTHGD